MDYRHFGKIDFEVSAVGFGGAAISGEGGGYGFGEVSEADAIHLVHHALELGVNLFDTAPIYGFGTSEKRLGKALYGHRRDHVFIVSKCGVAFDDRKRVRIDNSPRTTRAMLEQSLRDLGTENIDLYLVHWPDPEVDIRATMEVLARAQEDGKITYIGLSNTSLDDLAKAQEIVEVSACQGQFNLFENQVSDTLFPTLAEEGIRFMSWGTLDKGILTGRVFEGRTYDKTDVRDHAPWWTSMDRAPRYRAMDAMSSILKDAGFSGLELAVSYVLRHQDVATALSGGRTQRQWDGLLQAVCNPMPDSVIDACLRCAQAAMGES